MKTFPIRQSILGFLLFFITFTPLKGANIIFDLGDVLIETNYVHTFWHLGPLKMAYYASTGNNPFSIHKKLYKLLSDLRAPIPGQIRAKDTYGNFLPQLMSDWLKGIISGPEIFCRVNQYKDKTIAWSEELLVRSLAQTIFIPPIFVKTRSLVAQGICLIEECKKAGHKLYILSNWDPDSFRLIKQNYPAFFNQFDGIVISGNLGLIKPDPKIYSYLLNTYHLKPSDSIFIDDQPDNVAAAESLGIHGILYTRKRGFLKSYPDFDTVRAKINRILESMKHAVQTDKLKYLSVPIY
jgi:FMN phosphatase YigB (HAD superfamily)